MAKLPPRNKATRRVSVEEATCEGKCNDNSTNPLPACDTNEWMGNYVIRNGQQTHAKDICRQHSFGGQQPKQKQTKQDWLLVIESLISCTALPFCPCKNARQQLSRMVACVHVERVPILCCSSQNGDVLTCQHWCAWAQLDCCTCFHRQKEMWGLILATCTLTLLTPQRESPLLLVQQLHRHNKWALVWMVRWSVG